MLAGRNRVFTKHGQGGMELSDYLPHLGTVADEIALVRSMHTDALNHHPAQLMLNSGVPRFGRPSMGAWLNYGLGSDSEHLPGFVVMTSTGKFGQAQPIAARQWTSGLLPSRFQGGEFHSEGDAVLCVARPEDYAQRVDTHVF